MRIKTTVPVLVAMVAAGATLAGPAQAAPADHKVVVRHAQPGDPVKRIGALRSPDWGYQDLRAAFGKPKRQSRAPNSLKIRYSGALAGTFVLANFGQERAPRASHRVQWAKLNGPRWQTSKGIRVGSSVKQVRNRYGKPHTKVWRGQSWDGKPVLKIGRYRSLLTGQREANLELRVKDKKVTQIRVFVGAAGD